MVRDMYFVLSMIFLLIRITLQIYGVSIHRRLSHFDSGVFDQQVVA